MELGTSAQRPPVLRLEILRLSRFSVNRRSVLSAPRGAQACSHGCNSWTYPANEPALDPPPFPSTAVLPFFGTWPLAIGTSPRAAGLGPSPRPGLPSRLIPPIFPTIAAEKLTRTRRLSNRIIQPLPAADFRCPPILPTLTPSSLPAPAGRRGCALRWATNYDHDTGHHSCLHRNVSDLRMPEYDGHFPSHNSFGTLWQYRVDRRC